MRLIPHPTTDLLMLVPFFDAQKACEAVAAIFQAGITPSGLEFMERDALLWTLPYEPDTIIEVKDNHAAHLLIEVDGFDADQLMLDCEKILSVLENFETDEVLFADSQAQKEQLWKLRRKVGEAVKSHSIYKEEDTVVPRFELPNLLSAVKRIGNQYGFKSVCYGHAGDGNLHINIIKGDLSDEFWDNELSVAISELFKEVIAMGGTISGEHGIGLVQKQYMPLAFNKIQLDLMRNIKLVFDPKLILNPGKIF
jgi:glycolate oxidase